MAWSGLKSDVDNQVEIIDLSGRRILSQQVNTNSLQLSGMQGGFYIVVVSDGTNVLRKKLFFKDWGFGAGSLKMFSVNGLYINILYLHSIYAVV